MLWFFLFLLKCTLFLWHLGRVLGYVFWLFYAAYGKLHLLASLMALGH